MAKLSGHMSDDFEAEMRLLRNRFAEMSTRCSEQVHLALDAFWTGSAEKMAQVEERDQQVDNEEKALDELVLRILALRQPVATDLRVLTACFKLITDLERVSDEGVGIANAAATGVPPAAMNLERLKRMAAMTEEMFASATRSFLERDEPRAKAVFEADVAIGSMYRDVIADVTAFASQHSDAAAQSLNAMNVARCLERIADHAANIAEGTRFVIHDDPMPR
jgi:phosphate transport system protein